MFDLDLWLLSLQALLAFGVAGWLVSLVKKDVSIVDSLWSIMFLIAAVIYYAFGDAGPRGQLILLLVEPLVDSPGGLHHLAQLGRGRGLPVPADPGQQLAEFRVQEHLHRFRTAGGTGLVHLPAVTRRRTRHTRRSAFSTSRASSSGRSASSSSRSAICSSRVSSGTRPTRAKYSTPGCGASHVTRTTSATSACGGASS